MVYGVLFGASNHIFAWLLFMDLCPENACFILSCPFLLAQPMGHLAEIGIRASCFGPWAT